MEVDLESRRRELHVMRYWNDYKTQDETGERVGVGEEVFCFKCKLSFSKTETTENVLAGSPTVVQHVPLWTRGNTHFRFCMRKNIITLSSYRPLTSDVNILIWSTIALYIISFEKYISC